jgi:hypothetical protein
MLSILSNLGAESQERPMAGDRSMSGPEDDIAQAEKRRIIREQATTFHQHAQSAANDEAGGRFATVGQVQVVGAGPVLKYPAAGVHQADPVGTEPPLGYSVDDMPPHEPSAVSLLSAEQTDAPAGAISSSENLPPTQDESGDAGAPFSPTEESK